MGDKMKTLTSWTIAGTLLITALVSVEWLTRTADAQTRGEATWSRRTPWGDPELQGEWTSEGEYGVPFERPPQFGSRPFLTDEEYAKRLDDVRIRDDRDLAAVDVLAGNVEGPSAPIPHWREYGTNSRRTSLIIDPPDWTSAAANRAGQTDRAAVRQPPRRRAMRLVRRVRPRRPLHRPRRRLSRCDVSRRSTTRTCESFRVGICRHHVRAHPR